MKKLRLGLGHAIIGISHKGVNPVICFIQNSVEGKVGNDITGKTLVPPDFELEIVGLEGLVVLEEFIKQARLRLEAEQEFIEFLVNMEHLSDEYKL